MNKRASWILIVIIFVCFKTHRSCWCQYITNIFNIYWFTLQIDDDSDDNLDGYFHHEWWYLQKSSNTFTIYYSKPSKYSMIQIKKMVAFVLRHVHTLSENGRFTNLYSNLNRKPEPIGKNDYSFIDNVWLIEYKYQNCCLKHICMINTNINTKLCFLCLQTVSQKE